MKRLTQFKISGDGLLNGNTWYSNSREDVQNWLAGKDDEWLILQDRHIKETAAHDNWLKIQSYEQDLVEYNAALTLYNDWVWSKETPDKPDMPEPIQKPLGYYTQEEVDASITAFGEWETGYNVWMADTSDTKPTEYWIDPPVIYKRPIDITEPVVTALPDPVPNVPEPEFTQEELDAQAYAQSRVDRTNAVNEIIVTTTAGNSFNGDEVAQGRMARAILSLPDDTTTVGWKLSNNTFANVTRVELSEALALAGSEQAALWIQYG